MGDKIQDFMGWGVKVDTEGDGGFNPRMRSAE
jgi:hypothetical protein